MAAVRGAPHGSLPPTLLRLIPRDEEERDISRMLLEGSTRLVSLVGPPGAGKTRLAIAVAARLTSAFAGGVTFVDLSVISDPAIVPAAIATAIGMREVSGDRVGERLASLLRKRTALLVLDNFEHLLSAASFVAELITSCPGLKILATTREALHLTIEDRFAVGPLPLPLTEDETNLELLAHVPSVALFCMRASSVDSRFAVDAENAHAIAELCRRLDGLPLAIELAAAWAGVLSPRAILGHLEQCLAAEVTLAADQPERHRTLSAAIGWSYELLDEPKRAFFDQLSVFVDGWDEEAAAAVAKTPLNEALPLLAALTEKHVVVSVEEHVDGEPRFRLLDTLKSFAETRLTGSGLVDAHQRHAEHYLELAERAERALIGPDQRTWLDRLERELGNVRAALEWFFQTNQTSNALRLAAALWFFWDMRGHLREGQRWLEAALDLAGGTDGERAGALNASGWLALVQHGSYAQAIGTLELARSTSSQIQDTSRLVRAEGFLGLALALGSSDFPRAEQVLASAAEGGRAIGDNWALALALYGQGHVALVQGQAERCQERWQTCAAVAHSVGNLYGLSYLQFRWGVIALLNLELDRATACLTESLRLSAELDSIREMAVAIAALVLVAAAGGQGQRAAKLAGSTQALLDRAGCDLPAFLRGEYEKGVAALQARLGSAVFEDCAVAGRAMPVETIIADARSHGPSDESLKLDGSAAIQFAYSPLSAREWEIARHVARGARNREIADALVLTERTVGSHLERIFGRLEIRNRAQLAAWVAERLSARMGDGTPMVEPAPSRSEQSSRQLRVMGE